MAIYQLADGTVVSGTVAAGDASTPSFLIADDGRAVDLTGASEIVQPERTLAEQLGFSPLDIKRYAARGIPEEEVGSRLQSYLQQYGQSPSDVNWWGQNARDRVMGLAVDPRQEAAEQYSLGQAIMRSQQDETDYGLLPLAASIALGGTVGPWLSSALGGGLTGSLASKAILGGANAALSGGNVGNAVVGSLLSGGFNAATGGLGSLLGGGGGATGGNMSLFDNAYDTSVDQIKPEDYGNVGLDYDSYDLVGGGTGAEGGVGGGTLSGGTSDWLNSALNIGSSAVKSLLGDNTGSTGSRTISGATPALQIMRNALENKEEGKNQSPYKAKLPEQLIYTGQPLQVPTLFAGIDPKLIDQMNRRGYAMGGQVEPTEYVPGPEGKYFARHAKRGFAVNGPGTGQSDDIPTMLADGEYVIDSDTVAALGDGSSKAGAAVLDKFREEIRKHKRSAPIHDIPPKAKSPLAYLKEAQKGKKNG